jgi:hypothetical protein
VLSTQLGTRHRAGIGITEETDAIAVIVSEETGAISMAIAGKIERDLTAEQLRNRLSSELKRYMSPVALPTVGPREEDLNRETEPSLRDNPNLPFDEPSARQTEGPRS